MEIVWTVDRRVGDGIGRSIVDEVDIGVGDEVDKLFELEVEGKDVSINM